MDFCKALIGICFLCMMAFGMRADCQEKYSAGLLRSGMSGEDLSLAAALSIELTTAGYEVVNLDNAGLCDESRLSELDLLVLPDSSSLPSKSIQTIEGFLRQGGDIIALNTPAWQRALINLDGRWLTKDEYQREQAGTLPENVVFNFSPDDIVGWNRATNDLKIATTQEISTAGPAAGLNALKVQIPDLTGWDTFNSPELDNPFKDGHTLTVFSAKGGLNTGQLMIEWQEKDRSRWIAVVPLYPKWRQYVITPDQFKFWHSNPDRGFRGDKFNPANAERMGVGMAFTHMGSVPGSHEYWIGPFGTAKLTSDVQEILDVQSPPRLDSISPSYKLFDCSDVASLRVRPDQGTVEAASFSVPNTIRSPHPRPKGGGFDKGRAWRFIPLVEATTASGDWRGIPVTMTIHAEGPFKGGVWTSFGIEDSNWYQTPEVLGLIRQIAAKTKTGVFILDGGTNFYTYFDDQQVNAGVKIVNVAKHPRTNVRVHLSTIENSTDNPALEREWLIDLNPGEIRSVAADWKPDRWPNEGFTAYAWLTNDKTLLDEVCHELNVWKPKRKKEFITIEDREFRLNGERWRANGINYMPSSGIGTEDGEYFEHWMGARSYDPEIIQRDLDRIKDIGYNSVSIFVYHGHDKAQNLLDILRRLENLGLKANLSLRPGTPMDFPWEKVKDMIQYSRLAQNDTVFLYDLAWEPSFGTQRDRSIWDADWESWVIERYGSVENAERDWGVPIPRDDDRKITNPLPHQIDTDGEWRVMVAAYRRFLDTLLYKKYGEARRLVRSIDPNHFVSFRMSEAGNPYYIWEGRITYDFPYLAAAVDVLEPEAYGRIGNTWERVKPGWFTLEYARWAAPNKPMIWAEQGVSAWENSRMISTDEKLKFQADFYNHFYDMITQSGADGIYSWWYPGGFRFGENSDYGVINPDGSDRPVTKIIREQGHAYLQAPSAKTPDFSIEIDRDSHTTGLSGIYAKAEPIFWKAIERGFTPGLKTAGTGTDSSNCPLIAVGNVPCTGENPPKYLDGSFDVVQVRNAAGQWESVRKGQSVEVKADEPVIARVNITNLGEARLLAPSKSVAEGGVYVVCGDLRTPIPSDVPHLGEIYIKEMPLTTGPLLRRTRITLLLDAEGRAPFGEKFPLTLIPR